MTFDPNAQSGGSIEGDGRTTEVVFSEVDLRADAAFRVALTARNTALRALILMQISGQKLLME